MSEMPDLAGFTPYVVPVIAGLIVVRLLLELLFALARRGPERVAAVRAAWGRYLTGMFFAGLLLPFLSPALQFPVNTTPFWVLLLLGGMVAAAHQAVVAAKERRAGRRAVRGGRPPATGAPAQVQRSDRDAVVSTPARPGVPAWPAGQEAGRESVDREIGRLPMPLAVQQPVAPLPTDQAERWYERQDARLGRSLQGQSLAAARLRLSTVKSMLLLGQLGVAEADRDVERVLGGLRGAGRG